MISLTKKKKKKQSEPWESEEGIDFSQDGYLNDFEAHSTDVDLTLASQTKTKRRLDFLTLFVIAVGAASAVSLALQLMTLGVIGQLSNKPAPTLVELQGGRSVSVAPIGNKERTTESIQFFVSETLVSLFDWRGMIPANDKDSTPMPDPGVDIGNGQRVTYSTWAASYRLEDSWRAQALSSISNMTPQSLFDQNVAQTQGVLVVREMGQPKKTNEGQWQIDVVANLILFSDGDNIGKAIPFNKVVTVAAIDVPVFSNDPSDLQTVIYKARKSGMIIQFMEDLKT